MTGQKTVQGSRLRLDMIVPGNSFIIDCRNNLEGGIAQVTVSPTNPVEQVPQEVIDAVKHQFELIGYSGTIRYENKPIELSPL